MALDKQTRSPEKMRRVQVESNLEGIDGTRKKISVLLEKDQKARALAFFDIDETLASLSFLAKPSIHKLFPQEKDADELQRVNLLGYKLGTSFREHDRLIEIYEGGHREWIDPEKYRKERYEPNKEDIDGEEGMAHKRAAESVAKYDVVAAQVTEEEYQQHPEKFEEVKIKPMLHLAELYQRLGMPMVLMTANPRQYALAVAKVLDLADMFIDIGTDETMKGGGKEKAMEYLIKVMESKGIKISLDRLIAVGDSIRGDVGSLAKVSGVTSPKGVLILHDQAAVEEIKKQIASDSALQELVSAIDTEAIALNAVPLDSKGKPHLGSAVRREFLTRL